MYLCIGQNGYYATANDLNMIDTDALRVFEVDNDFVPPERAYPVVSENNTVEWIPIPSIPVELTDPTSAFMQDVFDGI